MALILIDITTGITCLFSISPLPYRKNNLVDLGETLRYIAYVPKLCEQAVFSEIPLFPIKWRF